MITEVAPGIYQGTTITDLDYVITEHFNAGQKVDLRLAIPRDLNEDELYTVKRYLEEPGLMVHSVKMSAPGEVQILFDRPSRPEGYAILPLVVLVIGALGAVGVAGLLGWKIGEGIGNILDSIGRMIIPVAVIIAGGLILNSYLKSRRTA